MKFIRPRQVLDMIGVSRTTLWRMVQAGLFPAPVRITQRNSGYVLEAVEAWMKAKADGGCQCPSAATSAPIRGRVVPPNPFALARRDRNQ